MRLHGHVTRFQNHQEPVEMFAAIGQDGGVFKIVNKFGIEYLQRGELDQLRQDGVREISLAEINEIYLQELKDISQTPSQQLNLF